LGGCGFEPASIFLVAGEKALIAGLGRCSAVFVDLEEIVRSST
jgi:hypothetical protein